MPVNAIPDGYHTVTPYLIVDGVEALLNFLKAAFDADVLRVTHGPVGADGKRVIGNAEVRIGNSMVMGAMRATG